MLTSYAALVRGVAPSTPPRDNGSDQPHANDAEQNPQPIRCATSLTDHDMPNSITCEIRPSFRELYSRLLAELGPQDWWPADSPFEMMVGAVLTQNTAWRNVETSIGNLRDADLLTPTALASCEISAICVLIRPSGFMMAKAATLVRLAEWVLDHRDDEIAQWNDDALRASLLELRGIGPETADAISMYAYNRALFIWDAYARRVMGHIWNEPIPPYEVARRRYDEQFRAAHFTISEAQEFHALIVPAGKRVTPPDAGRRLPR